MIPRHALCLILMAVLAARPACAATGDSRTVVEPSIPAACGQPLLATLQPKQRVFADALERRPPDTARIQAALDRCASVGRGRGAVLLRAGTGSAFLSGPLRIGSDVTLAIDAGVTLFASRNPSDYQNPGRNRCGQAAARSGACRALITLEGRALGVMGVRDRAGHQGSIDGRGDLPMLGSDDSWWRFARKAKADGLTQNNPDLIRAQSVADLRVYHVNLLNAPYFHLFVHGGDGVTVWGVRVKAPANSPNTDGLDLDSVTNATLFDNDVMTGDDGVAIKTSAASSANITVRASRFYGTHGISIGSEVMHGVGNVLVDGNSLVGHDADDIVATDNNGLRIKTGLAKGGPVRDVTYRNTCLFGVAKPLVINPLYGGGHGGRGAVPTFERIVVDGLKAQDTPTGKSGVVQGYSAAAPLDLVLAHVSADVTTLKIDNARIGVDRSNLQVNADSAVTTYAASVAGTVPVCDSPPVFPTL
ncbi:probable polygalacturonase precursor protein [Xanthomonas albilineans GPE PC73]|uniref:Probable polygalacturonase protein n=1 Tax=Xanthomonas albilineans (strain GPE PC73 / CFBP 7063) TaxID=380358 RepID=D2UCJ0_XANAP|nr:probable polygalacturonase precursor protein [Xanthomonas albilineans GPE PC73]